MAWRFKASKYKNAAPIVPKFEHQIRDLAIGSYRSHGNFIAASAAYMAFNWDINGSNIAVLPLDTKGRQNRAHVPLIHAHSDMVTDFQFSPFDDGLLATGSQDALVKLWRIPEKGMPASGITNPILTLPEQIRRVESINFHPIADCILASSAANMLTVWDLLKEKEIVNFEGHGDEVQSVSWQPSGGLLASQCKDRQLRIMDPRQGSEVSSCNSHQGIKDSKVIWLSDNNRLLTTGFSADRFREIFIRDVRNLSSPQKTLSLDISSGILVPLYDVDTNMCFLAGKGDRNIQFVEISNKEPFIIEGLKYCGEQTKGACLVPKRAMDVMQGEVNRVLQLGDSSIIPITWQVPRKSYREYHPDIYPETIGLDPGLTSEEWMSGKNDLPLKINLDPKKRPVENLTVFRDKLGAEPKPAVTDRHENQPELSSAKPSPKPRFVSRSDSASSSESPRKKPTPPVKPRVASVNANNDSKSELSSANYPVCATNTDSFDLDDGLAMLRRQPSLKDRRKMFEESSKGDQSSLGQGQVGQGNRIQLRRSSDEENKENKLKPNPHPEGVELRKKNLFVVADRPRSNIDVAPSKRPVSKSFGRVSKFRHLKGEVIIKGKFENLRDLSKTCPAECNFIKANGDRVAVPLTGPGGKIAVFETKKPGRIPDGVTPVLINGTTVMDFAFDPFDNRRLVAACDDGSLKVWKIPEGGLLHQTNSSEAVHAVHADKVQIVQFHPTASDIILTAAFDKSVCIWNLNDMKTPAVELNGHTDQIYSIKFSQCGRFVASVCRDGKIRIFDPRSSPNPVIEGGDIVAKKGARIVWVRDGEYIIVTGFSKQSERQVMMYKTEDLSLIHTEVLEVSPAILVPHYDEDSNVLFLTGKGESTVTTFEVCGEHPFLFPLSPYKPVGLHQGFAFLPKSVCDVKKVEFARAYRLTTKTIEPISFTVPRVKKNFFQDDLFPPTKILWKPTMTAEEWINGCNKLPPRVDLKPEDMPSLTGNNIVAPVARRDERSHSVNVEMNGAKNGVHALQDRDSIKKKEGDIESAVSHMVGDDVSHRLEQDNMEGVDEKEWEDEEEQTA